MLSQMLSLSSSNLEGDDIGGTKEGERNIVKEGEDIIDLFPLIM